MAPDARSEQDEWASIGKRAALTLAYRLAVRRVRSATDPPRRILVVDLDNIGDLLLPTPAIRALRRSFPDATLDVLGPSLTVTTWIFRSVPRTKRRWKRGVGNTAWPGLLRSSCFQEVRSTSFHGDGESRASRRSGMPWLDPGRPPSSSSVVRRIRLWLRLS